jgi:hypothetical protein
MDDICTHLTDWDIVTEDDSLIEDTRTHLTDWDITLKKMFISTLQCIENLHYSDLLNSSMSESSSVTMPQSVR